MKASSAHKSLSLDDVSSMVERVFAKDGNVAPVWFANAREGKCLITPSPADYETVRRRTSPSP